MVEHDVFGMCTLDNLEALKNVQILNFRTLESPATLRAVISQHGASSVCDRSELS